MTNNCKTNKHDASIRLAGDIKKYLNNNELNAKLPDITYEILAMQLIDSVNKAINLKKLTSEKIDPKCSDPKSALFDPIKAILALRRSNYDEACWLSFLLIYTDDSEQSDWAFMRQLYGGVGLKPYTLLTWEVVNKNQTPNMALLDRRAVTLAQSHPKPKFGHHRAYESLAHLPIVLSSYINFIYEQGGHSALFQPDIVGNDTNDEVRNKAAAKTEYFKTLYPLIRQNVYRFGRLSTFEFLCLLGKTGLASVAPDSCYIAEASGPKRGAKLLFGMLNNAQLDEHSVDLADYLNIGYQEMEEALCHWQKSPTRYVPHN